MTRYLKNPIALRTSPSPNLVMPGLVPGIHEFRRKKDVDGRDRPGHDEALIGGEIVAGVNRGGWRSRW